MSKSDRAYFGDNMYVNDITISEEDFQLLMEDEELCEEFFDSINE